MASKAAERLAIQFIEAVHPTMRMQFADAIDEALREREQDIADCIHAAITYYCGGPKLRAMTPRETADWIIKRAGLPAIDEALRKGITAVETRAYSDEFQVATSILTAAEQSGFVSDGTAFDERVDQRKEFLGRVIEILRNSRLAQRTKPQ